MLLTNAPGPNSGRASASPAVRVTQGCSHGTKFPAQVSSQGEPRDGVGGVLPPRRPQGRCLSGSWESKLEALGWKMWADQACCEPGRMFWSGGSWRGCGPEMGLEKPPWSAHVLGGWGAIPLAQCLQNTPPSVLQARWTGAGGHSCCPGVQSCPSSASVSPAVLQKRWPTGLSSCRSVGGGARVWLGVEAAGGQPSPTAELLPCTPADWETFQVTFQDGLGTRGGGGLARSTTPTLLWDIAGAGLGSVPSLFSWCGWDQAPCTPRAQAPHQRPLLGAHGEASASSPPAALGTSPRACPGRSLVAFGSEPGRGTGSQQQSPPAAQQPGPGLAVGRPGPAYRCERGFLPSGLLAGPGLPRGPGHTWVPAVTPRLSALVHVLAACPAEDAIPVARAHVRAARLARAHACPHNVQAVICLQTLECSPGV